MHLSTMATALPQPQGRRELLEESGLRGPSGLAGNPFVLDGARPAVSVSPDHDQDSLFTAPPPSSPVVLLHPSTTRSPFAASLGERLSPKLSLFQISAAKAPPEALLKPSASGSFASTSYMLPFLIVTVRNSSNPCFLI
jgi:hypothetical protein